jgi:AraC family transcriptional regulator
MAYWGLAVAPGSRIVGHGVVIVSGKAFSSQTTPDLEEARMIDWTPKRVGALRAGGAPRWSTVLSSGTTWTGMRLDQGEAGPGELPEGQFRKHLVGMHLGGPSRHERSVEGQLWRTDTIVAEDIAVLPAGVPFAGRVVDPVACLIVQIDPEFLSNAVGADIAVDRLELRCAYCVQDALVAHLLYGLQRDVREGMPCGRLYGDSLGHSLVAHLIRNYAVRDPLSRAPKRGLGASRLRRVVGYINDRLEADLSMAELAALVGVGADHFARAFKQTTGTSAYRYVLLKRIDRACELLRDPRVPIAEIAARCGFAGQSSFTTAFRRVKRTTPLAYRNGCHSVTA